MNHTSTARGASCALVAVLATALGAAPDAAAQPGKTSDPTDGASSDAKDSPALAEARSLFIEGNAHYSAGRYALAAERFIRAYELSGHPALLFNLANTYERAGDYQKAAHYLRLYLDGGNVHDLTSVRARLQRLELAVIELQKQGDAQGPDAATPPSTTGTQSLTDSSTTPTRSSSTPYYLAGGGFVVGAPPPGTRALRPRGPRPTLAVTGAMLARSERSTLDELCVDRGGGLVCPASAASHLDDEKTYRWLGYGGAALAGASLVVGLVYYLSTRSDDGPPPASRSLSVVPASTGDGFGVVAAGRF
jgi:tetratricopeptide (TPR) repeat protein